LRQIVSLHNPGEALDLQQLLLDVADHSLRMLTGGEVATVGHRVLLDLIARRPEVGSAIFKATLIEGSIFREWVLNVGRRDARTRIAHFLCEFYVRLRKSPWVEAEGFDLPMTQEQLADVTGLTPVHINRTLKGLEKEGLIRCSRRSIALVSWRGLQEAGQFDGRYLHLGQAA
jgi:CRP-like cAMP-binding protein